MSYLRAPRPRPLLTPPNDGTQMKSKLDLRVALKKGAGHYEAVELRTDTFKDKDVEFGRIYAIPKAFAARAGILPEQSNRFYFDVAKPWRPGPSVRAITVSERLRAATLWFSGLPRTDQVSGG